MGRYSLVRIALLIAVTPPLFAQTYTVMHRFGTKSGEPGYPSYSGILAQSRGGYLFSTAYNNVYPGIGAAFRITPEGSFKVLHTFKGSDGQQPEAGLTLGTDGFYYGTTEAGGAYGFGTIFKMTQDGAITTLYDFHGGADGDTPDAPPIESEAGDFYGTTTGIYGSSKGSLYRITKYGDFTLLHTFTGADGGEVHTPLLQGNDYFFYGTATSGGTYGYGTIFRVSRSGDFTVLYNFDNTHGGNPFAGLVQASDGNFYGVTAYGGSTGGGVIFKMTPDYAVTVIHTFNGTNEGSEPIGGLVQATDGNLYGTNISGPSNCSGVLFRMTLTGNLTVLHKFTESTGICPEDTLLQHTNGLLYGTTFQGGEGNIYSLNVGLKPFVTYLPTYGQAGALVQILGQGFTSDSTVSFNGVPASFTAVYPTYIRAFVPGGATSGPITVKTPTGTLTSNKIFIIHP